MSVREEQKENFKIIPLLNESTDFSINERDSMIENIIEKESADLKKNYYETAGLFSTIFFSWVYPVIKVWKF